MADSLLDLGITTDVFIAAPDWSSLPTRGQDFGREIIQYNMGIASIRNLTNDVGQHVDYGYSNMSKPDEYYLLNFFHGRMGRLQRFWLPVYFRDYELTAALSNGSYILPIRNNGFHSVARYYERIFLSLYDGSLLTRQVLSSIDDETLIVSSAWDRDIALSEVAHFGKLMLCRFDQDEVEINHMTDEISTTTLAFQELAKEYVLDNVAES